MFWTDGVDSDLRTTYFSKSWWLFLIKILLQISSMVLHKNVRVTPLSRLQIKYKIHLCILKKLIYVESQLITVRLLFIHG